MAERASTGQQSEQKTGSTVSDLEGAGPWDDASPDASSDRVDSTESERTGPGADEPSGDDQRETSVEDAKRLTRSQARELRSLLARYIRRHLPPLPPKKPSLDEPPRAVGAHARLLPLLRLVPWVLAAIFVVSFLWDFPGRQISAFGRTLELEGLLRILSVSGLIGFLTNWLAITMLFNPRERRPIFGQGLIPAQRERVIYRLARAISEELINEEIIKAKIEESGIIGKYRDISLTVTRGVVEDPDFRRELKALAATYLDSILSSEAVRKRIITYVEQKLERAAGQGLGGLALKAYRFLNEEDFQRRIETAVRELPGSLDNALDEIDLVLDRIPEKIEARSHDIEEWVTRIVLGFVENLDVYDMIISNMEAYDERQLEALIKNTSNEQLNYIKYLGGVLGTVGGLVIWRPFLALGFFGALGATLYVIDEVLFRRRRALIRQDTNPSKPEAPPHSSEAPPA